MIDSSPKLSDDTLVEGVRLLGRIRKILISAGLKTIDEVRETSDADLLRMQDIGKSSVIFLRKSLGLPSSEGVRAKPLADANEAAWKEQSLLE